MNVFHRIRSAPLILAAAASLAGACIAGEEAPLLAAGPLPAPPKSGGMSLAEALWKRRSVRAFSDKQVTREQLAFLLWAADGVNRPDEKRRTVPSAWGMNGVSVYAVTADGAALYDPIEHSLRPLESAKGKDLRPEVAKADFTRKAPLVLVLAVDFTKYGGKAGPDMLREFANCEAGSIAQNIYLAAAALGLGTVVTADARPEAKAALGLAADGRALYTLPVGHPAEAAPGEAPGAKASGKD